MPAPVTFYFKPGCHLCDDMWQHLLEIQEESYFDIASVDIDQDKDLKAKYGTLIPVLAAGDKVLCNYYLDPIALDQYLKSSAGE